jgi:uncharacterized membrane protein
VIAELTDRPLFLHILAAIIWLGGLVVASWNMVFKPGA